MNYFFIDLIEICQINNLLYIFDYIKNLFQNFFRLVKFLFLIYKFGCYFIYEIQYFRVIWMFFLKILDLIMKFIFCLYRQLLFGPNKLDSADWINTTFLFLLIHYCFGLRYNLLNYDSLFFYHLNEIFILCNCLFHRKKWFTQFLSLLYLFIFL